MEKEITIEPQYPIKDYFKVSLLLFFRKPGAIIVISCFVLLSFFVILNYFTSQDKELFESAKPIIILTVLWPLMMVFFTYRTTQKSLDNPKLKEDIKIRFTSEYFEETGQTFSVKYSWSEILKIEEKNDWFLIFLAKNKAKIVRKADLSKMQLIDLKTIFNSLPIKKSLK